MFTKPGPGQIYRQSSKRGERFLTVDAIDGLTDEEDDDDGGGGRARAARKAAAAAAAANQDAAVHASFQLVVMCGVVEAFRDVKWLCLTVLNVFGREALSDLGPKLAVRVTTPH
jgi:hypothetical protein